MRHILLLFLLLPLSMLAQEKMNFETSSWADVLKKARQENKMIFLDAYASWCGPCKWMAATTFTNDTVVRFYNANFINVKMDMEKGEGPALAEKFQVSAYPNLLYIGADGEIVHRTCGARNSRGFIAEGLKAMNPYEQFTAMKKKFEAGERDAAFISGYIETLAASCLDAGAPLKEYLKGQTEQSLTERKNWNLIYNHLNDPNSREFQYLVKNRQAFTNLYGKDSVNEKIESVYLDAAHNLLRSGTDKTAELDVLKKSIAASGLESCDRIIAEIELTAFEAKKDWKGYAAYASKVVDKHFLNDPDKLNSISWNFYENIDDKKLLMQAEGWARKAAEIEKNPAVMDTHAAVLFKLGRKKEAQQVEEQAIARAKELGYPTEDYEAMLKKIKGEK